MIFIYHITNSLSKSIKLMKSICYHKLNPFLINAQHRVCFKNNCFTKLSRHLATKRGHFV